jgi:hypothetical protein
MKGINFRRVFVVAGLMSLIVISLCLWVRMVRDPTERTGSDFISAYTGGRVADLWGTKDVYDLDHQQAVQEQEVGFQLAPGQVLMFNHPPFLIPVLSLLMTENYLASMIRYTVTMVVLYVLVLGITWRVLMANGWEHKPIALTLAGIATFYPVFVSLINTQDTAIMVLGGILWLYGLLSGRDWLAGMGLALTSVRPQMTLMLSIPFLFRRQKVFLWSCVWVSVLGCISLLTVGVQGLKSYFNILLISGEGDFYGMKEPMMVNLIGLLWRVAPGSGENNIHITGWVFYGLILTGLCILWARQEDINEKHIGLAALLSIFAAPHLHYHDLAFLIVPLVALLLKLVKEGYIRVREASLVPLITSLSLLFGSLIPVLHYNLPYLIMLLVGLLLWFPKKILPRPFISRKTD